MPTSTVPAVPAFRAALLPLLQARPGLQGVQVEKVWPGPTATPRAIYLASRNQGPSGRFEPANLTAARQRLNEMSDVSLALWSWRASTRPTDDPEDDLFVLFNEVVGTVMDNPTCSSTVQWTQGVRYEITYPPFEKGRSAFMEVVITLSARLI